MSVFVTIGVCVRNSSLTLPEAIESIMAQDFAQKVEVIFVNDGSDDNTLSIIEQYRKKMVFSTRVFSVPWSGLGVARNMIVENSQGKYIIWVDGDMIIPKDHVRKQVEFMEENPSVGVAKARHGIIPCENVVSFLENIAFVAADSLYGGKITSRTLGTGGSIYRVEAIHDAGGFDVGIKGAGEDMDIETRIRRVGWGLFLASPGVFYEQRRTSLLSLLRESFWHGYGRYTILKRNGQLRTLIGMHPAVGFLLGSFYSMAACRITRRKMVVLLPFQYSLKRIAWFLGFIKSLFD